MRVAVLRAAEVLLGGGVIAYPTEGVFGLGCLPDDEAALARLLAIKQRSPDKGLILIAASAGQLDGWVELGDERLPAPEPAAPVTWLVEPASGVSPLVTGSHDRLAVRITGNPVAAALCDAVSSPIVSTSANIAGRPPARTRYALRRIFGGLVDYVVPGDCGPASGPSEIRDFATGRVLRQGRK